MDDQNITPVPTTEVMLTPKKDVGDLLEQLVENSHELTVKYLKLAREAGTRVVLLMFSTYLLAAMFVLMVVIKAPVFDRLAEYLPLMVIILIIHGLARALDTSFAWLIRLIAGTVLLAVAWELAKPLIGDYAAPFIELGKAFLSWMTGAFS